MCKPGLRVQQHCMLLLLHDAGRPHAYEVISTMQMLLCQQYMTYTQSVLQNPFNSTAKRHSRGQIKI